MPWEVRITTELVHTGANDDAVGSVYQADGTILRVIERATHSSEVVILHPDHLPSGVADLMEGVHQRLEAQRDEIIANMNAGVWGGIFKPDGTPDVPPYDRTRINAVVVTPLQIGHGSVVINIGGYGEPMAAQYVFESPIVKLVGDR